MRFVPLCELKRGVTQKRIFEPISDKIKQVIVVVSNQPGGAYRPVVLSTVLGCCVPALDDPAAGDICRRFIVVAQPGALDHGTASSNGRLLVLCGGHVGSERLSQLEKCLNRFVCWMKRLADLAWIEFVWTDRHQRLCFRDCRQAKHLPLIR